MFTVHYVIPGQRDMGTLTPMVFLGTAESLTDVSRGKVRGALTKANAHIAEYAMPRDAVELEDYGWLPLLPDTFGVGGLYRPLPNGSKGVILEHAQFHL